MEVNKQVSEVKTLAVQILNEIRAVLDSVDDTTVKVLVEHIIRSRKIVVHGAGRMGSVSSVFAMRLAQLGFHSHALNESTTLAVSNDDLLIICSASGETQTIYDVALIAKQYGVKIAVFTARKNSRIANLADTVVFFNAPNKLASSEAARAFSIQPLTTLAEQSIMILLDIIVILLMKATHQTSDDLQARHRNLE